MYNLGESRLHVDYVLRPLTKISGFSKLLFQQRFF